MPSGEPGSDGCPSCLPSGWTACPWGPHPRPQAPDPSRAQPASLPAACPAHACSVSPGPGKHRCLGLLCRRELTHASPAANTAWQQMHEPHADGRGGPCIRHLAPGLHKDGSSAPLKACPQRSLELAPPCLVLPRAWSLRASAPSLWPWTLLDKLGRWAMWGERTPQLAGGQALAQPEP